MLKKRGEKMKVYRVGEFHQECKAEKHEISDVKFLMSRIDYRDTPDGRVKDFNNLEEAEAFAAELVKTVKAPYEFSSPIGRMFAFGWVDVQGYDVELDEYGNVDSEDFDGNIYKQYINA
jgi:hypothetical protein